MIEFFIIALLILSAATLFRLIVIDLKYFLLPDTHTMLLAICGVSLHALTQWRFCLPLDAIAGAALGGGMLLIVRFFANLYYKQDALGLGDVKLMAACGLWLGHQDISLAIAIGALCGVIHGTFIAYLTKRKEGKWPSMQHLGVPAGPGFIVGFVIIALVKLRALPLFLFS